VHAEYLRCVEQADEGVSEAIQDDYDYDDDDDDDDDVCVCVCVCVCVTCCLFPFLYTSRQCFHAHTNPHCSPLARSAASSRTGQ
jgi:hypothetical protein